MVYCANCGHEMSELAVACPNCGHPNEARMQAEGSGPRYASYGARVGAYLLDGLIMSIPTFILLTIFSIGFAGDRDRIKFDDQGRLVEGEGTVAAFFGSLVVVAIVGVLYKVLMEGSPRGQTVGKMALRIAVRDQSTGGRIGYGRALLRWFVGMGLWFIFYIPGIIDLLFPLWDSKKQTIHDKAASSVVVAVS